MGNVVMFLSTRDTSTVFVTNVIDREVAPLKNFKIPGDLGLSNLMWEPKGSYILFTTRVYGNSSLE